MSLKMKVVFIALLSFLSITGVVCQTCDICQSLRRLTEEQCGQPAVATQNHPRSVCACDPCEVEELKEQIRVLSGSFADVSEIIEKNRVELCGVGIKDGSVRDEDLSESSSYHLDYRARYARLDNTAGDPRGFWHASHNVVGEWVQVDLKEPTRVVGVITQGRPTSDYWITSFEVFYTNSTDNLQVIRDIDGVERIFQGNTDRNSHVTNLFPQPIRARYFRLVVHTFVGWPVIRMEYLTC